MNHSSSTIGMSIVEVLNLKKWEEPEEENIPNMPKTRGANAEKAPQGWSIPHYDIEGIRKYLSCVEGEQDIILTEKLHGCFRSNTPILMANGDRTHISNVNVGDYVLGVDVNGNVVPSKVLNKWNNGESGGWVKVNFTRSRMNRGASFKTLYCTKNHEFYSIKDKKYIPINKMQINDTLSYYREDISIPDLQKQIMLGKILGDGSIGIRDTGWSIWFGHVDEDKEYFDWTCRGLGDFFLKSSENEYISGYVSKMFRGSTVWNFAIRNEFSKYISPSTGIKIVHEDIINDITPIVLAFWYMDDGSLSYADEEEQEAAVSFATCGFSENDHKILQKALLRFNIESNYRLHDGYLRLYLTAKDAEKLFLLIAPYIPNCMQRKLPLRYRGAPGWLPNPKAPVKYAILTEQSILSIEDVNNTYSKWDLETETHNYFANGVLAHNSNASFCHDGEKLWCKSRNYYKKRDPDDMWWEVALRYDLENKLSKYPGLAFFAECIGQVKGFRYDSEIVSGKLHTKLYFFDIWDTKQLRYLDYDEFKSIIEDVGLQTTPVLYRGPWTNKEEMYALGERKTTLGGKHIAEGWVLCLGKERFEPRLNNRCKLKFVSEAYNLQK